MLAVRGRRQTGKSRLITELVETSGLPYLYFTAVKNAPPSSQLGRLTEDVFDAREPLPDADSLFGTPPTTWSDALGRLAVACQGTPTIVVLDEFPWATATDATLEGLLQNIWDKRLQHGPVLWILIGSDVAMMERLTDYDRPLYGRASAQVVKPFDPAECATITGWSPMAAFDAFLVTGGYPRLVLDAAHYSDARQFIAAQLTDENNDFVVIGQSSIDVEFPEGDQARRVLTAIGGAEVGLTTFSEIVGKLTDHGTAAQTATTRAVKMLAEDKGVIAVESPIGAGERSKLRRYRIDDPYLRFWFRFVAPQIANIARGRSDIAVNKFERSWSTWRGMAIEPLVREAIFRLAPDLEPIAEIEQVGAWWNRQNTHEYDIVAADASGRQAAAIGSIKWREQSKLTARELTELAEGRAVIPGASNAALIAICPAGIAAGVHPDLSLTPQDLLAAWS